MTTSRMDAMRLIRASDLDRDRAVEMLHDAYAVGRLSRQEFDERSAAALTATTWGELEDLTADLPATRTEGRPAGPVARRSRAGDIAGRQSIQKTVACLLVVMAGLTARVYPPAVCLIAVAVLLMLILPSGVSRLRGRGGRPGR